MDVSVPVVRTWIESGITETAALAAAGTGPVLLWSQQHPDGPDGLVSGPEFLRWRDAQPDPDRLPCLSVAVSYQDRAINLAADNGAGTRREDMLRWDGADRPQIVETAARRYIELADWAFAAYR